MARLICVLRTWGGETVSMVPPNHHPHLLQLAGHSLQPRGQPGAGHHGEGEAVEVLDLLVRPRVEPDHQREGEQPLHHQVHVGQVDLNKENVSMVLMLIHLVAH